MAGSRNWERRWHPLLREWVILAATTSDRPWSGDTIVSREEDRPEFDPGCYLCPGVKRASGTSNPRYVKPYAFTNDFASFSMDAPDIHVNKDFEISEPVHGSCRVICFSPKHNLTMAELTREEMNSVYGLWKEEYKELGKHEKIENVLIFENKGKVIGVSNPHPHGQIYATGFVPKIVGRERESFSAYYMKHGSGLLTDLVKYEQTKKERVILENDYFIAFIPFFARFVFETYIVPKKHASSLLDFNAEQLEALADIHLRLIVKFDNLYKISFPNITMMHNSPTDDKPENKYFQFHIEFYPPMRSPDKLKYLAGFESGGGNIINPVKPEYAAGKLRESAEKHYKKS